MQEPNQKREDKLEEREIRFGAAAGGARVERQHGKLYRWFDNFWYHYKWHTIATVFVVFVLVVCVAQMCGKESEGDIKIVMAGPYSFTTDEAGLKNLQSCLGTLVTEDINGDGEKKVSIISYTIYSDEEADALKNQVDENGESTGAYVDGYTNTQQYQQYNSYTKTGDASVYFLSPWLFEELSAQNNVLTELSQALGEVPSGGVTVEDEEGNVLCYGVRLGDTALYQNNNAMQVLPEDTIVCLMGPFVFGSSSDEDVYAAAVAYFKALTE